MLQRVHFRLGAGSPVFGTVREPPTSRDTHRPLLSADFTYYWEVFARMRKLKQWELIIWFNDFCLSFMALLLCAWHHPGTRVSEIRSTAHKTKPYPGGLSDSITRCLRAQAAGSECPGSWSLEGRTAGNSWKKNFPTSQSLLHSALLPDRDYLLSQRWDENMIINQGLRL